MAVCVFIQNLSEDKFEKRIRYLTTDNANEQRTHIIPRISGDSSLFHSLHDIAHFLGLGRRRGPRPSRVYVNGCPGSPMACLYYNKERISFQYGKIGF